MYIYIFSLVDPWLIRKDSKKSKEKKNKKKKKTIDPDSIQSALLASGLGSTRPAFTTPVVKSTSNSTVAPGGWLDMFCFGFFSSYIHHACSMGVI